jgi:hypothetical protein
MTTLYYYLVLLNAVVTFAAAAVVFWRNRSVAVGPLLGGALMLTAVWLIGYSHYLMPVEKVRSIFWARLTLGCAILTASLLFHALCALIQETRRYRPWIIAAHSSAILFLALLLEGHIVAGLRPSPNMDHYIRYNRGLYLPLVAHLSLWQILGAVAVCHSAWRSTGYKRTQLIYFMVAWSVQFVTVQSIIVPLEYDIDIPPAGLFLLPLNMAFLAYVMARARLADYNVVIARVLLHALTILVVVVLSLLTTAVMTLVVPGFMGPK